jgi:hypothetical protein
LYIFVRQLYLINLPVDRICPEVPIGFVFGHGNYGSLINEFVSELHRKAEIEVKEAGLAHVLQLCTGLTDFCLLVTGVVARLPAKHSKRPHADLALAGEL